jgi:hypothetical protein
VCQARCELPVLIQRLPVQVLRLMLTCGSLKERARCVRLEEHMQINFKLVVGRLVVEVEGLNFVGVTFGRREWFYLRGEGFRYDGNERLVTAE